MLLGCPCCSDAEEVSLQWSAFADNYITLISIELCSSCVAVGDDIEKAKRFEILGMYV